MYRAGTPAPIQEELMKRLVVALAAMGVATAVTLGATAHAATRPPSPTTGLTRYTDTFKVQHPYNLKQAARFSLVNGVYSTWIIKGDKPLSRGSHTGPRTEMRWLKNWSSGEHMFEADVLVDPGTDETAIFQVKSNTAGEPIYLYIQQGDLYHGSNALIARHMVGSWFHLTVDYNPSTGDGHVWINNQLVFTRHARKNANYYFKNGVYNIAGSRSETHWKNITFWRK
jgi:hypothetical protein